MLVQIRDAAREVHINFPRNQTFEQLDRATAAAFNVCTAAVKYLTTVYEFLSRGKLGMYNLLNLLSNLLIGSFSKALLEGESAFIKGKRRIENAVGAYNATLISLDRSRKNKEAEGIPTRLRS